MLASGTPERRTPLSNGLTPSNNGLTPLNNGSTPLNNGSVAANSISFTRLPFHARRGPSVVVDESAKSTKVPAGVLLGRF